MKFPYNSKQLDSMDCGPSCLCMVAKYHGKSYSIQSLHSRSFMTKSGVSMLGISEADESIGFRKRGCRFTWEQLRDEVPLPCIVHWNQRHFVVVYRINKRRAWGRGQGGKSHAGHARHASKENPKPDQKDPDELPIGDEAFQLHEMQDPDSICFRDLALPSSSSARFVSTSWLILNLQNMNNHNDLKDNYFKCGTYKIKILK